MYRMSLRSRRALDNKGEVARSQSGEQLCQRPLRDSASPRHVDNQSCRKCHGDQGFMDKEIALGGTVKFVHAKHLRFDKGKQEAVERNLRELTESFRERLLPKNYIATQLVVSTGHPLTNLLWCADYFWAKPHLEKLEEVARSCIPAKERNEQMADLVKAWGVNIETQQLTEFSRAYHMEVRVAQLADLQCTNCHSYGAPSQDRPARQGAHHFTVKTTSCFTCHFINQDFNTGTGACLKCHTTLPAKEIIVHPQTKPEESAKLKTPDLIKQTVKINHPAMVERKVNCISCHADVATENSTVTRRDCEHCHDDPQSERHFGKWQLPLSVDLVKHYHSLHVPEQRAKCLDCHSEIHHQLVRGNGYTGQPVFLSAVMANCLACHPNQHAAQIALLSGTGGVGVAKGDPNSMFGSRTNCLGCHTKLSPKKHGGVSAAGDVSGCASCHPKIYADRKFNEWKLGLEDSLADAKKAYTAASQALEKAKDLDPEVRRKVTELLNGAQADLWLVEDGKGLHNAAYSVQLLESVVDRSEQVKKILAKESGRKP